ncbi:hypothetical protein [Chryseobacterium taiwanense]|uniref:Uncharacterized protein n=1 Tax=Chryseobacterium taiwanense TaxID=363331 RepID=A0A0B4E598_9FLAO|nr:hypothetical protein [Chryseobacterium taiwanense]KIC61783.1 hypothetical protein RM51_15470 [Chryseobacterium taiwanense]
MKTSISKNQYVAAHSVLLFLVSVLMGYNIYQEICHPEKSDLFLSAVLVAITAAMVRKYGLKTEEKKEEKF